MKTLSSIAALRLTVRKPLGASGTQVLLPGAHYTQPRFSGEMLDRPERPGSYHHVGLPARNGAVIAGMWLASYW
jgi:hypothetical protein